MSLNDDVVDDLPINDDRVIEDNTDATNALLVEKVNSKYKTIVDSKTKTAGLVVLGTELATEGLICRSKAKSLMEDFSELSNRVSVEEFTVAPSTVNLNLTQRHMTQVIGLEDRSVTEEFGKLVRTDLNDMKTMLTSVIDDKLIDFRIAIKEIALIAENVVRTISTSKDLIIPYSNDGVTEFLDITTIPLSVLDLTKSSADLGDITTINNAIISINKIIESSNYIRTLIHVVIDNEEIPETLTVNDVVKFLDTPIDILTLAKFFNSNSLIVHLNNLDRTITNVIADIDKVTEVIDSCKNYSEIDEILTPSIISRAMEVTSMMLYLNRISISSRVIFESVVK